MVEEADLVIEPSGVARNATADTSTLAGCAGAYRVAVATPGMLLLGDANPSAEGRARVLMAGEIVTRMTVMEVINVIATANWRGTMLVATPLWQRRLYFDQGALKGAMSSSEDDRLGEVIFRSGGISRRDLERVLSDMSPTDRFGETVVARGIIDQAQLFQFLQRQSVEIFHGALLAGEGYYVFHLPTDEDDPVGTQLHIPIHGLLMEGVQRIDEMALFRERVPSSQMCPVPVPDAPAPKKLDETAEGLLRYCDGRRTIEELARLTGHGEFATTKAVYHLLQAKMVTLRRAANIDVETVARLVASFNEVMQDIFVAVATYGGVAQTRATLDAWIEGSGYGPFFGQGMDDFGCVDAAIISQALHAVEHDSPVEALHQALHELAAFALFSATTTLPRDQELTLARDVNRRLKLIRIE
ncbi:MAG: hypothetical protein R3B40_20980 [Polyangiales bacterium]|nr:hypothetical protein [Myxococcales bacterium]MCB9658440.1 hypothetical protein [Sandaracinaceae bacterium]